MIKYNVLWVCGLWLMLSGLSACSSSNQELEPIVDPIIPLETQDSSYVVGDVVASVSNIVGVTYFSKGINNWYIRDSRRERLGNGAYVCMSLPETFQTDSSQRVYYSGDLYRYHISSKIPISEIPPVLLTADSTSYCIIITEIRDYQNYQHTAVHGCFSGEIYEIKDDIIHLVVRSTPEEHPLNNTIHEWNTISVNISDIPEDMQKEWNILDFDIIEYKKNTSTSTDERIYIDYFCKIKLCS